LEKNWEIVIDELFLICMKLHCSLVTRVIKGHHETSQSRGYGPRFCSSLIYLMCKNVPVKLIRDWRPDDGGAIYEWAKLQM